MAKWGVIALVLAFVATIILEWGANVSDTRGTPYAVKVNGDEISFEEVDRAYGQRLENAGNLTETDQQKLYKTVVDELVGARLAMQEAERLKLRATDHEIVDQTRERLFRNEDGNLDLGRFARARRDLPASQWAAYEKVIGEDITQWKVYNWVSGSVVVTPEELRDYYNLRYQRALLRHILVRPGSFVAEANAKAYYDAHGDSFIIGERVRGRHILFRLAPGADAEQRFAARSRAEALLLRLRAGENFGRLFAQFKADTMSPAHAEELDWFQRGQMVPAFDTVAFNWPVGIPTEIIETEFGYHIALFDAHEMPHRQAYADVADGIRNTLSGDSEVARAKALAEDLRRRIAEGADFAALARQFSSGKSASNGGLLGDVIPGEMTPELYPDSGSLERIGSEVGNFGTGRSIVLDPAITRAVFDLEVGKPSDVIQSGHGFHVVRIERRRGGNPDLWDNFRVSTEREYRDFLKNQLYRDWLDALRKRADIVYAESVRSRMEQR